MSGRFYQNMAIVQISYAQVLYINYYEKDIVIARKISEGRINLKINIFHKHRAMLGFLRTQYHHAKAKEPHFIFLHINHLKPFIMH